MISTVCITYPSTYAFLERPPSPWLLSTSPSLPCRTFAGHSSLLLPRAGHHGPPRPSHHACHYLGFCLRYSRDTHWRSLRSRGSMPAYDHQDPSVLKRPEIPPKVVADGRIVEVTAVLVHRVDGVQIRRRTHPRVVDPVADDFGSFGPLGGMKRAWFLISSSW